MWTIIDPYATYLCNIWILQTKNYTSAIRFKNPERVLPDIRAEPENWCHQQTASCSCQWTLSYKHAVENTAKLQYQWNIALLLKHCSVARILLSVHHCIPFLHPSVQNAQNIQNVLESLFLRWINIDMTFFIIPKNLNNPVQLGSFQLSVVCLPNSLCGFNWH